MKRPLFDIGIDFRKIYDQFADPVFLVDSDSGRILDCNSEALIRYGYSRDEFLRMTPLDLHPPEERERALRNLRESRHTGPHLYHHLTKDGRRIPVEVNTSFIHLEGKSTIQVSIIRDISERQENAERLRQSEIRFRQLFEQCNDGVIIHRAGQILEVNHRTCEMLGYTKQELLSMSIPELHAKENRIESRQRLIFIQSGAPMVFETQWLRKDGTPVDLEISSRVIVPEKQIVQGIVRDITERKRVEEALRSSEERYRILAENVADGVAVLVNDRFTYVNDAMVEIFGYEKEYLLSMDPVYLIREEYREEFEGALFAVGKETHVPPFQSPAIRVDGTEIWTEQHLNRIVWEGRPAVLATIRDVTETRQRELEMIQETEFLRKENARLRNGFKDRFRFGDIIGKSPAMQEVYELILKCSVSDVNVVIYGESGTGKELVARTIHRMSEAREKPFVPVNCGAIPESLFESEFFGHRKGAFTGAVADKHGYFDLAQGGTLFLDEIGELPLAMQAKLLRAIDGGGYMPVGGNQFKEARFRILAATNRDLYEYVLKGLMREDFFYRIHIIPIHLPPLRERKEDIPILVEHFIQSSGYKGSSFPIPAKIMDALCNYDWPGNVRELQNVLNRYLTVRRLDLTGKRPSPSPSKSQGGAHGSPTYPRNLRRALDLFEKSCIERALEKNRWHRGKTAAELGIPPRTLHRKMKKFRLISS